MKKAGLLFLFCLFSVLGQASNTGGDVVDDISRLFKEANTKELSKYFSTTVSMSLLKDEGVYSKVQAEIVLRDFFGRHNPQEVSLVHRLDSNPNFKYVVLQLKTGKQHFRISYKIVSEGSIYRMTELRIE